LKRFRSKQILMGVISICLASFQSSWARKLGTTPEFLGLGCTSDLMAFTAGKNFYLAWLFPRTPSDGDSCYSQMSGSGVAAAAAAAALPTMQFAGV
jgi:hypothetical protein